MTTFVGIFLILSGVIAAATNLVDLRLGPHFGLWFSLVIDVLIIGTGFGLLRRWQPARQLALGMFFFGSLTFLTVPALFYITDAHKALAPIAGMMLVGILPPGPELTIEWLPQVLAAALTALLAASGISFWIYRHLKRADVASEFGSPGGRGIPYLTATLWAAIVFVPALIHSAGQKQQQQARAAEKEAFTQRMLIKQVHLSADGRSLIVSSRARNPELRVVDLTDGLVELKTDGPYRMIDEASFRDLPQHMRADRLERLVSSDHQLFFSRSERGLGITSLATDELRPLASLEPYAGIDVVPIGFRESDRYFTFYAPPHRRPHTTALAGGTIEMVDVAHDQSVYSATATQPEWLRDSGGRGLAEAIHDGRFSPDRNYFAYLYRGKLHLLNAATGALRVADPDVTGLANVYFSVEGDAILVNTNAKGGARKGMLYQIDTQETVEHDIHGDIYYFSTSSGRVIRKDDTGVDEFNAKNPSERLWHIPRGQGDAPFQGVSGDGLYLFRKILGPIPMFEYADLSLVRTGQEASFRRLPTKTTQPYGDLVIQHSHVIIYSSPEVEVIPIGSIGRETPESTVVNVARGSAITKASK